MTAAYRCLLREIGASGETAIANLIKAAADDRIGVHRHEQTDAWEIEWAMLYAMAQELIARHASAANWVLLLEFTIPRRGRRPDVVLLADDVIFVIEFKTGHAAFDSASRWQVKSYALDLRDFHAPSHGRRIVPILAVSSSAQRMSYGESHVDTAIAPVQCVGSGELGQVVLEQYCHRHSVDAAPIDSHAWERGEYHPTPTIIEAAQRLFAGHGVVDIAYNTSTNLTETTDRLVHLINKARNQQRRLICFVTGIPGAGKTLAGLNAAHNPALRDGDEVGAVFLSGNGPLINVIQAAIARDVRSRGGSREEAEHQSQAFIRPVHSVIKEYAGRENAGPPEHILVFDEAQRAWDVETTRDCHNRSEPEIFLEAMERRGVWCAVIALVGGGQEINTGEAGLSEWGRALNGRSLTWSVAASPTALTGSDAVAGQRLFEHKMGIHIELEAEPSLHLSSNVRSIRAQWLGRWVNDLLRRPHSVGPAPQDAEFPVVMTRDLLEARSWIEERAEGTQRTGLLASSGARRLRAFGIELNKEFRDSIGYSNWFLDPRGDIRSSSQLEVAATEYECQGLEIDWSLVCWGQDFLFDPEEHDWRYRNLSGSRWQKVHRPDARRYMLNKYRVILTRARRGMAIFVPRPSQTDASRAEPLLDRTADLLVRAGVMPLSDIR